MQHIPFSAVSSIFNHSFDTQSDFCIFITLLNCLGVAIRVIICRPTKTLKSKPKFNTMSLSWTLQ
jgi:hypothetical protein